MKRASLTTLVLSVAFLTACNLSATILGGPQEFSYTPTYIVEGQGHTIAITFTVENDIIVGLQIEPGGITGTERGHQLAFSANVRRHVLEQPLSSITLPVSIGEETQLTDVFRGVITQLQNDQ